jgi:hypothetical protein
MKLKNLAVANPIPWDTNWCSKRNNRSAVRRHVHDTRLSSLTTSFRPIVPNMALHVIPISSMRTNISAKHEQAREYHLTPNRESSPPERSQNVLDRRRSSPLLSFHVHHFIALPPPQCCSFKGTERQVLISSSLDLHFMPQPQTNTAIMVLVPRLVTFSADVGGKFTDRPLQLAK